MDQSKRRQIDLRPRAPSAGGETIVPEQFRPDAIDYLCERLSGGETLAAICVDPDMPGQALVRRWLANDPGFKRRYFDSMRVHALTAGQEILSIADGPMRITHETVDENGESIKHYATEDPARSKLRVDTRFKMLAKLEPEVFGEKIEHGHNVVG